MADAKIFDLDGITYVGSMSIGNQCGVCGRIGYYENGRFIFPAIMRWVDGKAVCHQCMPHLPK